MNDQQNEGYPLDKKIHDISSVFLLLERVLPAAIEHYQDEESFKESFRSSILRPFAEATALECNELEEEFLQKENKEIVTIQVH